MFVDGRSTYNKNLEFFLNVDRPMTDITNCLPKDGRWLRDVRRIIQRLSATDTENIISWPNEHKIGRPTNKEVYIGQENGCWTADCCPDNPFFPQKKKKKTNGRASFFEMGLGFQAAISVILILLPFVVHVHCCPIFPSTKYWCNRYK